MKYIRINKLLVSLHTIMANDYFQFKQFIIHQERCAMKVGTDGTLLGAWAQAPAKPCRILDIGTGTALIALMMAQRFPDAHLLGVDIDANAVAQASENVMDSPFADRITIRQMDIAELNDPDGFDVIVCNPPFFVNSLTCPNNQRTTARHAVSLTYEKLIQSVFRLLKTDGLFSVIIPTDNHSELEAQARLIGLFVSRVCLVKTMPQKALKRQLIEFRKQPINKIDIIEETIESKPNSRSTWYQQLTQDFYIK